MPSRPRAKIQARPSRVAKFEKDVDEKTEN
jgi:hypothetical protein